MVLFHQRKHSWLSVEQKWFCAEWKCCLKAQVYLNLEGYFPRPSNYSTVLEASCAHLTPWPAFYFHYCCRFRHLAPASPHQLSPLPQGFSGCVRGAWSALIRFCTCTNFEMWKVSTSLSNPCPVKLMGKCSPPISHPSGGRSWGTMYIAPQKVQRDPAPIAHRGGDQLEKAFLGWLSLPVFHSLTPVPLCQALLSGGTSVNTGTE